MPLYQGGMIHLYDAFFEYGLRGLGRSATWTSNPCDQQTNWHLEILNERRRLYISWPKYVS